jgi:hypothetical protein
MRSLERTTSIPTRSALDIERYSERCDKIIESELKSISWVGAVKLFRRISSAVKNIPKLRGIWQRLALKKAATTWRDPIGLPWSQIRRINGLSAKVVAASEVLRNKPRKCGE